MINMPIIEEKLEKMLSPKRFAHSQRVSRMAAIVAEKYGVDPDKAALAGLLHDCARDFESDKLLQIARDFAIVVNDIDQLLPVLLHAPVGACIAKKEFGVSDEEILSAISLHTVGGRGLTNLDKIIYLSDFIEPGRKCSNAEFLRKLILADENSKNSQNEKLTKAMLAAYDSSIKYNIEKKSLIHPATFEGRNELLQQIEQYYGLQEI